MEQEMKAEILAPALEQISRAEFDVQVATAKKYPMHSTKKDIERFRAEATDMACIDEETAQACMYSLPRRDKDGKEIAIQGKSIRLAEIAVSAYGNIHAGFRIMEETDSHIVAQGVCHDLERNVKVFSECRRNILDRRGRKYSPDMITMTCNAAGAIAFRNAVFKVIPAALLDPIYEQAKIKATGDVATLNIRIEKMLSKFSLLGIDAKRILTAIQKETVALITQDDLAYLIGSYNAIKNGEVSPDEAFPAPSPEPVDFKTAAVLDLRWLERQIAELGISKAEFREYGLDRHGVDRIEKLTRAQADECIDYIKSIMPEGKDENKQAESGAVAAGDNAGDANVGGGPGSQAPGGVDAGASSKSDAERAAAGAADLKDLFGNPAN